MKYLVLIALILASDLLFGQAYEFRNYGVEDGVQQVQVMALAQDQEGYLWVGTHGGGVSKFDGIDFEVVDEHVGLSNNNVNAIAVHENGEIWVGTERGINIINDDSVRYLTESEGLLGGNVRALLLDKEGNMWVGSEAGLQKWHAGHFEDFSTDDGIADNRIRCLFEDKDGNIWIGTDNGITIYHDNYFFSYGSESTGLDENNIYDIYQDRNGNMWFCTLGDGLLLYDGVTFRNLTIKEGLGTNIIRTIVDDGHGYVWFGTMGNGLSGLKYDDLKEPAGKFQTFYPSNDHKNVGIWTSLVDGEGNLWFGSYGAGLFKMLQQSYKIFKRNNGLSDSFVWCIEEDSKSNLWVGTNNGGLFVLPENGHNNQSILEFPSISVVEGLKSNKIRVLHELADGSILYGTNMGFGRVRYNESKGKIDLLNQYPNSKKIGKYVRCMVPIGDRKMWLGTDKGMSLLQFNASYSSFSIIKKYTEEDGLTSNTVHDIRATEDALWVATAAGVSMVLPDSIVAINKSVGLVHDDVRSIVDDANGNLIIGTVGGISLYNKYNKQFTNITSDNGMVSDKVYFLHLAPSGVLWIGTNVGIEKFGYDDFRKQQIASFNYLSKEAGFVELEANTNAVETDSDGNMWFGTIGGLIKYYPTYRRKRNAVPPVLHIMSAYANLEKNVIESGGQLDYDENNITFIFSGISTTDPEGVLYSYKLEEEGNVNKWSQPTNSRKVSFNGLTPGVYTFFVKARNTDGVWVDKPLTFTFRINSPLWEKWWFILCVLVFVAVVIRIVMVMREKRLTTMNQYLEDKVLFRTKQLIEEKDKLEQAKRSIERKNESIFNSINYAKRIQNAILPSVSRIQKRLPELFVYYRPKEQLSGDFYFFHEIGNRIFLGVIDCTGHGIPGAIMSMLGYNGLNRAITEQGLEKPSEILNSLTKTVCDSLYDSYSDMGVKDGMDVSFCCIDLDTGEIEFSGAMNPVYIVRDGKIKEVKGDPQPIGMYIEGRQNPFSNNVIKVQKGDIFYMFSDGYADQFGGPKGKKFKYKSFKNLLLKIHDRPMDLQKMILEKEFDSWKGSLEQLDDVCVVGWKM